MTNYNDAWLGLEPSDLHGLENPFFGNKIDDDSDSQLEVIRLMRNPKYIGWTCKILFNIELLPMQIVIMQELFEHSFPLFIACRGFGKSFILSLYIMYKITLFPNTKAVMVGAAFRQSKLVFEYCEAIWYNSQVLRSVCGGTSGPRRDVDRCTMRINSSTAIAIPIGDGCVSPYTVTTYDDCFGTMMNHSTDRKIWNGTEFVATDEFYDNGIKDVLKLKTNNGYNITGTYNHKLQICRNESIIWARLDEIKKGDKILIDRSYRWHHGNSDCNPKQALALGLLIGDGCWTVRYRLGFATKDTELIGCLEEGTGYAFKQCSDKVHYIHSSKDDLRQWLDFWGMEKCYTINKKLPEKMLSASRECMTACIQGLFDSDGHVFTSTAKGGMTISVHFTNTSKELVEQLQYILLHYGIISTITSRQRKNWNRAYDLIICGRNVKIFAEEINFNLKRKRDKLNDAIDQRKRWVSCNDIVPISHKYVINLVKKYSRSYYCYNQGLPDKFAISKILSRKKLQLDFIKELLTYVNDEKLSLLCNKDIFYDEVVEVEPAGKSPTYDMHVPGDHTYIANGFYSHNSKIRGLRANLICCDEFASLNPEIYETVIAGFAAVSQTPIDNVKMRAKRKAMQADGEWTNRDEQLFKGQKGNQAIISGTASYSFNHFHTYWQRYKHIIECKGDIKKLTRYIPDEEQVEDIAKLDYRDFCIIRIPYKLVPPGFMDEKHILRAKATMHAGIHDMEYNAIFSKDSQGFFKRSLIESCVATDDNVLKPNWPKWCDIVFDCKIRGHKDTQCVFGIDPASEEDNFALVILEIHPEHQRTVHLWTTNRHDFKERQKAGLTDITDYYGYCVRKIRDLMKVFPCARIGIDSQGGGHQIVEGLHDKDKMHQGEIPIWEVIEDKEKETDNQAGSHIIEVVNFAKADWTSEANHGLRKDMEDKVLLLPRFDTITLSLSTTYDKENFDKLKEIVGEGKALKLYDTLEDCALEIETLKDELSTIVMTQTGIVGRDRWDTPEVKLKEGKKGRMRKDRYSALVIANMLARQIYRALPAPEYLNVGLVAGEPPQRDTMKQQLYSGPEWANQIGLDSIHVVRR